jgi:hypothetical protein
MAESKRPSPFGRIFTPNQEWLAKAKQEEILEPETEWASATMPCGTASSAGIQRLSG